ncbi:chaperone DnaJ-domain superfamily protein [Actinidia rufa]|uniref:Chaperone DnaJ-domain superfamily protein n=1 Tax=Actinidia rufa TaxID=165716 RepID=A0A7J0FU37_9ERIC|nr:chaperone DnaJ-domain superfamily protein [Actinidia rufa]
MEVASELNWEASVASQVKPKSLWEELAEIIEEFVEFLEKELNITDAEVKAEMHLENMKQRKMEVDSKTEAAKQSSIEDDIDEIETTLAQLKRELGL